MNFIYSILYGIIEGITEWLPISSTGHMILAENFMKVTMPGSAQNSVDYMNMFLTVIQLGAILAVLVAFLRRINPWARSKTAQEKRATWSLWGKIIVGCIPAGVIGILLDNFIHDHLYTYIMVAVTLLIYGVAFIWIEVLNRGRNFKIKRLEDINYKTALIIGAFQVLALVPGTSRSGATILGAMIIGIARPAAAEFSFLLAVPVMFGASAVAVKDYGLHNFTASGVGILLVGMTAAFIVSLIAIRFLMGFLRKHDFKAFGYYRIALGVIVLLYCLISSKFVPVY